MFCEPKIMSPCSSGNLNLLEQLSPGALKVTRIYFLSLGQVTLQQILILDSVFFEKESLSTCG